MVSDNSSSQYKGVGIFGFGSIIPMDLIKPPLRSHELKQRDQLHVINVISGFNSYTVTLNGTPNNEYEKQEQQEDELIPIRNDDVYKENNDMSYLDGPTRFSSSQNFSQMTTDTFKNNNDNKNHNNKSLDFSDVNLISSIVTKAELGRVSLIGLIIMFMKITAITNNVKMCHNVLHIL